MLALSTTFAVLMCLLKEAWPSKTTLQNFFCSLPGTEVSPTCLVVAKRENTVLFLFGDTPSKNLVWTVLPQIWIIPMKELHLGKKSVPILFCPS